MRGVCAVILLAAFVQAGGFPDGYVMNQEDGHGYKLVYQAETWQKARDICAQEGAKLAVPKSDEEFAFIQKLVRAMHYPSIINSEYKLLVWLGVHNLDDYTVWQNVDGEDIEETGFNKWASQRSNSENPAEPHCAGVDAINPGLRDFWCHRRQPFMCEIQITLE